MNQKIVGIVHVITGTKRYAELKELKQKDVIVLLGAQL
jgi:hypothetical protein